MENQPQNGNSQEPNTGEIPFIYPSHWEADVVLRDGSTAHLRPVVPTDKEALRQMYAGQSERTIYLRFFAPKPELSEKELAQFTTVNHVDRVAFILMLGEEMLGIGRFDRTNDPTEAEVAFMISDRHQGRGIGSILLEHLAAAAKERGISRFTAEVLPQNRAMLNVFKDTGYEISRSFHDGFVLVQFNIDPTDRSRQVMEAREHRAEAQSIAELLAPQKIAVIGSANSQPRVLQEIVEKISQAGFTGDIVCVDQRDHGVAGFPIYSSILEVDSVDLAVITVPIEEVESAVEECGKSGVRGALIYTAGYAEDGARGRARQQNLVRVARSYGMRIIGPASYGILNNSPTTMLNAILGKETPSPGKLGVFSQSAVMGQMFSNMAIRREIGVSSLVSAGNRADVSGNDLMQYWEDDPETSVCALYLESMGNSRKFSRIARRLSHNKPVIVAKHAVTGLQLPPGHSGRTSIVPALALDSLLEQSGVISAESSEQVLDVAQFLVSMPLPRGRRIAVVSNAAALTQMVADRALSRNLELRSSDSLFFSAELASLSAEAETVSIQSALNEVTAVFRSALEASDIDALIGVFMTESVEIHRSLASALGEVAKHIGKPALGVFPGIVDKKESLLGLYRSGENSEEVELPCYNSPISAVDSIAAVADYVQWREQEESTYLAPENVKPKEVADFLIHILPSVHGEDLLQLNQEESREILAAYGILLLPSAKVNSAEEATEWVNQHGGYPVVLKSADDVLSKRLDLGGVRLGIENKEQLQSEFDAMRIRLSRYGIHDIEVQKEVEVAQSAVLEAVEDPLLGPVVLFGMSGDATSLLDDWSYAVPPLTPGDVMRLIRKPKAARKLFGENEIPQVRVDLLEDLAARLALLKDNHPEIISIQLSPIIISQNQLTVARAKISIGNPQQRTDSARRSLNN